MSTALLARRLAITITGATKRCSTLPTLPAGRFKARPSAPGLRKASTDPLDMVVTVSGSAPAARMATTASDGRSYPLHPRVGIGAVVLRKAIPPATGTEVRLVTDA